MTSGYREVSKVVHGGNCRHNICCFDATQGVGALDSSQAKTRKKPLLVSFDCADVREFQRLLRSLVLSRTRRAQGSPGPSPRRPAACALAPDGYAPSMGLPLCMALIGSATQRPIPPGLMFVGEVDLLRSVRNISMLQAESIRDVLRTDSQATPCVLVCSQGTAELLGEINEVRFSICQTLDQAVAAMWPVAC